MSDRYILTLSCPDKQGIVAAVANLLLEQDCNIGESAQFGDRSTRRFFMRVSFECEGRTRASLSAAFSPIGQAHSMDWRLDNEKDRVRAVIMVSRSNHCLNDLVYRHAIGELPVEIVAVVSNHPASSDALAKYGIPFHHIALDAGTKVAAEARLMHVYEDTDAELIILARYMQILSGDFCARLSGKIINIHHSFLPGFKGAKPYHQAHDFGVKLIGATAHYVTAGLDEGPIIEQEVVRVDHAMTAENMAARGRDIESTVLARAVTWHAQRRVLINGSRTIIFR